MSLATLTTKGQVTIPKKIRESLKLHTGDKIEIIVTEKMEAI
ncbi:MAG: AbrB/MazE/SpoVT family DNA-binding domain-containing protein, partial [Thermodesulfobacteriota bacterium]|nr:AbrB/MazE/SpoVT family DNA-binding domain-containing protein [Thermodesulfobacteriota bacterium]MEA3360091.1 AbrB/MazE/SpoVT family DNA-binding domain-containing protein [Thermodesulfobacteriota bacterium]